MAVAFFARVQKGASTSLSVREEREREKERKKERDASAVEWGFCARVTGSAVGTRLGQQGAGIHQSGWTQYTRRKKEKKRKNTHNHDNNNNNNKLKQIDASYTRTTDQRGVDAHRNTHT